MCLVPVSNEESIFIVSIFSTGTKSRKIIKKNQNQNKSFLKTPAQTANSRSLIKIEILSHHVKGISIFQNLRTQKKVTSGPQKQLRVYSGFLSSKTPKRGQKSFLFWKAYILRAIITILLYYVTTV